MYWKRPESMGWGNVIMCISDMVFLYDKPRIHSSILDVDRGVEFYNIEIVEEEESDNIANPRIVINPYFYNVIHKNISKIIKPSIEVQKLIENFSFLVTDVSCGIHIRRGAYSSDSKHIGCHGKDADGNIIPAYFASDSALIKFENIIGESPGPVFLASDSIHVKNLFKDKFPDKIRIYETKPVLTYKCDILKNYDTNTKDRLDCYVEWFLLSMCPKLFITGGNPSNGGISTYGYSAACYGLKDVTMITN